MKGFSFDIINFDGYFKCQDIHLGTLNSSCNSFSYHFKPGVYALTGDINDGGWAFAFSLTTDCKYRKVSQRTKLYINDEEISFSIFSSKYVQNLGLSKYRKNLAEKFFSINSIVSTNLKKNKLSLTSKEIQNLLGISNHRYNNSIKYVGYELPLCQAAIGISMQKKVFIFPYITKKMYPSTTFLKRICNVLREMNCIVLIPLYETNWIEGIYDKEINIQQDFLKKQRKTEDG